jgi:hypothetical protein
VAEKEGKMTDLLLAEHSAEVDMPESTVSQEHPALFDSQQSAHEYESRQVAPPPTTAREWQDAQPEKMLDRYTVQPICFAD